MFTRSKFVASPILVAVVIALFFLFGLPSGGTTQNDPSNPKSVEAGESNFFSTAAEESYSTYQLPGDGDLWPSCWADDNDLYTANGDGTAFNRHVKRYDMAVSRIAGVPPALSGKTLATNVGTNWSGPGYNRKPTGMLCVDGAIYLAFQNLDSSHFDDAPAASIARSTDHGLTWTWDRTAPMFGTPGRPHDQLDHKFTTIFFLDYGRDSANAVDQYVYAYGLDNNWRFQHKLFLARVPRASVQNRQDWEFFGGTDGSGNPAWNKDMRKKAAVLTDDRLLYRKKLGKTKTDCNPNQAVIGQGGAVYDAPLRRYIFSSWSCATHEFYEAQYPWGPWRHFLSNDFGHVRSTHNYGQYGTSIPSKFISADGKTLYLQSNIWTFAYTFSLRKIYLETYIPALPTNTASNANLALLSGVRAISKSTRHGSLCGFNCSDQLNSKLLNISEDDFDDESKALDWWGYIWPHPSNMNRVVYWTGRGSADGGWFSGDLKVQVRQNFSWIDVSGITVSPPYLYRPIFGEKSYTFSFPDTWGDGVRIIGRPGGSEHFTSIIHLGFYFEK
ncbi:MAG: DUF4185 domain-containing protein [Terriglobales bacterium]